MQTITKSMNSQKRIEEVFDAMKELVLYKNKMYGDSALTEGGIFYKGDAEDSILVRMNDKVRRIQHSNILRVNDMADLLGYTALWMVVSDVTKEDILSMKD